MHGSGRLYFYKCREFPCLEVFRAKQNQGRKEKLKEAGLTRILLLNHFWQIKKGQWTLVVMLRKEHRWNVCNNKISWTLSFQDNFSKRVHEKLSLERCVQESWTKNTLYDYAYWPSFLLLCSTLRSLPTPSKQNCYFLFSFIYLFIWEMFTEELLPARHWWAACATQKRAEEAGS